MRCGILRRMLAYFIDGLVIGGLTGVLARAGIEFTVDFSIGFNSGVYSKTIPALVSSAIYFLVFAYFNEGKTVGKSLLHMGVESLDGGALERSKLMFREGVKVLLLPLSVISFIICIFTPQRLALHDLIMNTVVVKDI